MIENNSLAFSFNTLSFPYLRLTESSYKKLGTACFLFLFEKKKFLQEKSNLKVFCLELKKKFHCKIRSKIFFFFGIPIILEVLLIFKEARFWAFFIIFLTQQSFKEKFYWFYKTSSLFSYLN